MIVISALSRDHVIGRKDGLPWHVPEEYEQFLGFVRGQAVVFGRRSHEIFGADLPDSRQFVVSRSATSVPGATVCGSLDEAVAAARATGLTVFCAGGASVYAQALPEAEAMYLSWMKGDFEGDARFPDFDVDDWSVEREEEHAAFDFVVYRRARPAA